MTTDTSQILAVVVKYLEIKGTFRNETNGILPQISKCSLIIKFFKYELSTWLQCATGKVSCKDSIALYLPRTQALNLLTH